MMEKLALLGGEPVKKEPFPAWPRYDERERQALMDVLDSRVWWSTPGTQTLQFEKEFAAYQQARHAVAVTNGTAALEVAYTALGIGPGDEVIVPDFTFVATASAVLFAGAMPVMVDVDQGTFCMDPSRVEAAITPRTKAIAAVHMAGHPADLDALTEIARKHGLRLLEDSSHAHGSEWRGRRIGAIGDIGTFSFQASKLMTAGEGGIIITNNDDLDQLVRSIHDCGRMPGEWSYSHFIYGSNYRLSEWQGAVLRTQLTRADELTAIRTANAAILDRRLLEIEGITPQTEDPRVTCNGHYAYIFHVNRQAFGDISIPKFIEAFNAEGFPTQDSYPPVHDLAVFQSGEYRRRLAGEQAQEPHDFLRAEFPNTWKAAWETVWLPQPALLGSAEDMDRVVEAIRKIQRLAKTLG
jgi:dTDP-4-amino-4,6-dideoxygalactose transaminase